MVLSDGGVCCIDEFNLMRESDRTSIHEAMEQQTISMAKAGIVCKLNTRCSVIAAANPKNLYTMCEPEGTNSLNIGIASPLLSRFDLVFILRDERIPEWDAVIAEHLLAQVRTGFKGFFISDSATNDIWNTQKLQAHFTNICNIQPKMSDEASVIIAKYYQKCRDDPQRDFGRTTVRLLDSLNRLAEAHARLVFRSRVTVADAITVIRLMESTYGFGRIVKPYDVIKEELPLGPENDEVNEICKIFDIFNQKSDNSMEIDTSKQPPFENPLKSQKSENLNNQSQQFKIPNIISAPISQANTIPSSVCDINDDELDKMLSLDIDVSNQHKSQNQMFTSSTQVQHANKSKIQEFDDEEDEILSQALDEMEDSQPIDIEPKAKIPRIDENQPNRLKLNINRFAYNAKSKHSSENQHEQSMNRNVSVVETETRNRIFCTPSDDECTQKTSVNTSITERQNVPTVAQSVSSKSDKPTEENDSAYQSQQMSQIRSNSNIYPSSSSTAMSQEEEEDILSCLEFD